MFIVASRTHEMTVRVDRNVLDSLSLYTTLEIEATQWFKWRILLNTTRRTPSVLTAWWKQHTNIRENWSTCRRRMDSRFRRPTTLHIRMAYPLIGLVLPGMPMASYCWMLEQVESTCQSWNVRTEKWLIKRMKERYFLKPNLQPQ